MSRRGTLEVMTDVLLGVDDVPLPVGASRAALKQVVEQIVEQVAPRVATPNARVETVRAPVANRGFEAELFAAQAQAPHAPVEPLTVESSRRTPAPSAASEQVPRQRVLIDSIVAPSSDSPLGHSPFGDSPSERLAALELQHSQQCPHCASSTSPTRIVFGEGDPCAELMFVGEVPSSDDDTAGKPFAGAAGDKLNEMIKAMGLRRDEVYLAHILKSAVKCAPNETRAPTFAELSACGPYLLAQCSIIRPKVIVSLGGPATKLMLATDLGISVLRGAFTSITLGSASGAPFSVQVMPTYHPAYLLRNYTMETRREMWSDLKQALAAIGRSLPVKAS
ncbi:MAG: uracil-DNA glycosylase [Planctomycetota bacterium]|nr:MAG: uracil-DNA glycosylase [Planctomycetota bacterium]